MDGHECDDVVTYRCNYLQQLKQLKDTHRPPPPGSDERATPSAMAETMKKLVSR